MTKPQELLPCPFCGGACEMWNANNGRPAWIACMGRCAVLISKEHKTDAEAIAAWNTRTLDPAVQALVEAARALQIDMLERAQMKIDAIHGEQYRIVNAGRSAWSDFCAALAAFDKMEKPHD